KRDAILYGDEKYEGIITRLLELQENGVGVEGEEFEEGAIGIDDLVRFTSAQPCAACDGTRLRKEALSVLLSGYNIGQLCRLPLGKLKEVLTEINRSDVLSRRESAVAAPLIPAVTDRLGFLIDVGLGYLSLDRAAATLSGGEGQRIRLATQIGARSEEHTSEL